MPPTAVYDLLLGPLTSAIEGKKHLIIIPDASAFLIPFEALVISTGPDAGKYVIERYTVTYHMALGHLIRNGMPVTEAESEDANGFVSGEPHVLPTCSFCRFTRKNGAGFIIRGSKGN